MQAMLVLIVCVLAVPGISSSPIKAGVRDYSLVDLRQDFWARKYYWIFIEDERKIDIENFVPKKSTPSVHCSDHNKTWYIELGDEFENDPGTSITSGTKTEYVQFLEELNYKYLIKHFQIDGLMVHVGCRDATPIRIRETAWNQF